jgi:hypothetical protein
VFHRTIWILSGEDKINWYEQPNSRMRSWKHETSNMFFVSFLMLRISFWLLTLLGSTKFVGTISQRTFNWQQPHITMNETLLALDFTITYVISCVTMTVYTNDLNMHAHTFTWRTVTKSEKFYSAANTHKSPTHPFKWCPDFCLCN